MHMHCKYIGIEKYSDLYADVSLVVYWIYFSGFVIFSIYI